jgi:succinate dehydrogenase/fumarate reductase cytochrome b subunit
MTLRSLHRASAILIAVFACLHIANHLAGLAGVATHIAFMEAARLVYRNLLVEIVLLLCVVFQVGSGLTLVLRGWRRRRGFLPWLQALSGAYLSFFLLVHVSAILSGRVLLNLDTNFYFAAAGFHVPPYPFFFVPYYFLAVVALFTHLGCAAYWQVQDRPRLTRVLVVAVPASVSAVLALLIVLLMAGQLQPFEVPAKYKATYDKARYGAARP